MVTQGVALGELAEYDQFMRMRETILAAIERFFVLEEGASPALVVVKANNMG